jgi:hypothetical protein
LPISNGEDQRPIGQHNCQGHMFAIRLSGLCEKNNRIVILCRRCLRRLEAPEPEAWTYGLLVEWCEKKVEHEKRSRGFPL